MVKRALNNWINFYVLSGLLGLNLLLCSWDTPREPPYSSLKNPPPNNIIRTEVGFTPEELVKNVFAGGTCDNISQIKGLGNPDGIGYFENGFASVGLDRGIILATGPVAYAANSNSEGDKSGDFGDKTSDPDLSQLATGSIRDRVGLEFDFVPLDSFVTFRYVFASEEYCEFVGSKYNDVFGFFVKGPGIQGGFTGNARNVALIPGSSDFVSINNVNHKKNSQYYIDNTRSQDAERCGIPYTPSERENYIEYDGFTVRLTAVLKLHPCETYHIRLVVADVADNFYDSAVFLEAGSFDIGGQVSIQAVTPDKNSVSEGCTGAYFEFKRESQSTDFPLNIRFLVSETTTAIPGEDYTPLPSSVTIPAGQQTVQLPIEVLNDELPEGDETLAIELDIPCACYTDDAVLSITDPPELLVSMEDLSICPEEIGYLVPEITGGNPGYSYLWNDSTTESQLRIEEIQQDPYSLTVTDGCGHQAEVSARVIAKVPPTAVIAGMKEICEGDTALLEISFSGAAPWNFAYNLDGGDAVQMNGITSNPYYLETAQEGDYELILFSDAACAGEVSGLASVDVLELPLSATAQPVSCYGGSDGRIAIEAPADYAPYRYDWEGPSQGSAVLSNIPAGTYNLSVTDGRGCSQTLTIDVSEPVPLEFPEIDCADIREGTWLPEAGGGVPPYKYILDDNHYSAETLLSQLNPGSEYLIRIEDANGCSIVDTLLAPQQGTKIVSLPDRVNVFLGTEYQFDPELHVPESLLAGLRWLPAENLSCDDCLRPFIENPEEITYTIRTIDRFGCTDEASTRVVIVTDYPIFVPNVFSPNGDDKNDRFGLLSHPSIVSRVIGLSIYNRWGSQVFQTHDALPEDSNASWDGNSGGRPAPPGIYVYQMEIELTNGRRQTLMGDVLLIR